MKKGIVATLLTLIMLFGSLFLLASCDIGSLQGDEAKPLSAPTNVKISSTTLTWNPVENAIGYTVKIVSGSNAVKEATGDEYMVDSNSYSLESLADGEYTLFVKARGDSVVWSTSDYSASVNYTRKRDTGAEYEDDVVGAFGAFDEINTRESYLGYGVNIIDANGITSKNIKITYPIFKKDALLAEMLLKSNEHYSNLETIEAETIEEFKQKLSNSTSISSGSSVSASGNIYGVDASASVSLSTGLKSSFEHTSSETYSQYFLEIIAENQNYWLILQTEESKYKNILSDEFKKDLYDNTITPAQLFDKYGTHLLTSVAMGGNITMFYTLYSYEEEVKNSHYHEVASSLKTSVDAVYGGYKAGASTEGSFQNTFTYEEIANRYGIRAEKKIVTSGGSGSFGIINEQSLYNNYADWQKSLDAYPVVVGIKDSNSLYPIWNLIDTSVPGGAERYNELYSYFAEYGQDSYDSLCDTFGIKPPVAPTDIVNITAKNVYGYQDGEVVQVKPGDSFKITFDVLPDSANKYKKTFSASKSDYITLDESGNVTVSETAPSRTEFTITVRAGTVEREIKFYVVQSCTVTFNTGFSNLMIPNVIVESSSLINEPDAIREGFTLDGWYKDANYQTKFNFLTDRITENTMLYAKWRAIEPTVTFDSVGGSDIESQTLKYNTSAKEPAAPYKDGYVFTGWYSNRSCTDIFNFTSTVKENITLYAGWELIYYTVTFNTMGGVEISPKTTNINAEYKISEVVPSRTYYEFDGWYRDEALANKFYFEESVNKDITLYAKWIPIKVTVNLVDTDGSTLKNEIGAAIDNVTTNVENNFLLSDIPIPHKMGYTFIGWKYNGEKINHLTKEFIPKSNGEAYTVVAMWDAIDVVINLTDIDGKPLVKENGEEIGAACTNVDLGFTIKNLATPYKNGYTFKCWTYDGEEIDIASMKFEPKANGGSYTLVAKWTIVDVSVKFVDIDGGVLKNEIGEDLRALSTNIEKDYILSEVSVPKKIGYTFVGWKYNGDAIDLSEQKFTPKSSGEAYTLIAVWSINEYKLTYKINGDTVNEVTYKYNEKISSFNPDKKDGHTFSGWTNEPTAMPAEDVTVLGSFNINSYTITYMLDGVKYGESETLEYGSVITLRANPTDSNKEDFSGWTYNGNQVPATMPDTNIIISGTFGSEYYNVTYYIDGKLYNTNRVCVNNVIPYPNPEKEGYDFKGWRNENGDILPEITLMTAGDKILDAAFELQKITIKVQYVFENGLETQEPISKTINYGEQYNFTVKAIVGYTPDKNEVTGTATKDTVIKVTYKANTYKLTINYIDYNGTTKLSTTTDDYKYGEHYTIDAKEFTGRCNPKITDGANGIMPAYDHIVTVKYERTEYRITIDGKDTGKVYYHGEKYSIEVPQKTGESAEVYLDGNKVSVNNNKISVTVDDRNYDYTVTYTKNKYTLTLQYVDYKGNIISNQTETLQVTYGETYLPLIPGKDIAGFNKTLDDSISNHIMPAGPHTVKYKYTQESYTVKINYLKTDGTAISISPISDPILHLDTYGPYAISAISGYNATVYCNGVKVTVANGQISGAINASDVTYDVKYSPITYKITYDLNASSILTVPSISNSVTYKNGVYNTTFDLHIPTAQYYKFVGWYDAGGNRITDDNGNLLANVSGYTNSEGNWVKASNTILYAQWDELDEYSKYTYIGSIDGLIGINDDLDGQYLLVKDIDLNGYVWNPIGVFTGTLNGNNKSIHNMTVTVTTDKAGLFSELRGAYILDLNLLDVNIVNSSIADAYTGSLAGYASESTITNCKTTGTIISGTTFDIEDNKWHFSSGQIFGSYTNTLITDSPSDVKMKSTMYLCDENPTIKDDGKFNNHLDGIWLNCFGIYKQTLIDQGVVSITLEIKINAKKINKGNQYVCLYDYDLNNELGQQEIFSGYDWTPHIIAFDVNVKDITDIERLRIVYDAAGDSYDDWEIGDVWVRITYQ